MSDIPPPSIHVRALITWISILPLVTVGMFVMAPLLDNLNPVLRALTLTLVVVPLAVYVVVPQLMKLYDKLRVARNRATTEDVPAE